MSEIDLMILPQTVLLDLRYGARMLRATWDSRLRLFSRWRLALG